MKSTAGLFPNDGDYKDDGQYQSEAHGQPADPTRHAIDILLRLSETK
jgi:hypothetical protein